MRGDRSWGADPVVLDASGNHDVNFASSQCQSFGLCCASLHLNLYHNLPVIEQF